MRAHGRPRNSVVPSYRPPQASDVAEARPLSPGSRGRVTQARAPRVARRGRVSHQTRSLPDLWLLIGGSGRWVAHAGWAIGARSVPWLE